MRSTMRVLTSMFVLCAAGTSFGQDLFSFAYSDLDGTFDTTTLLFSAFDDGNTDGEVTRLISPTGDAFFAGDAGENGIPGVAGFLLQTPIVAVDAASAQIAPTGGVLFITDVDDGLISAEVFGTWLNIDGSANFVGILRNVAIGSTDGTFDGTTGSISSVFPAPPPFDGNIINLTFDGWFINEAGLSGFTNKTSLTSGVVVPEPATLSLLALGGLACLIRRRTK